MKRALYIILSVALVSVLIYAGAQMKVEGVEHGELYETLSQKDGHELLEEYMELENSGSENLIPYAVVLADKGQEFEKDELINLIKSDETGPEVENALLEILKKKGVSSKELKALREDSSVNINTRMQSLYAKDADLEELKEYIYSGKDFTAMAAAQKLSFTDDYEALLVAVDLLRNHEISYYQFSAINVILDQYYRYHPQDEEFKKEIISRMLALYQQSQDEQEHHWIMDALGWMQDFELFQQITDNNDLNPDDKFAYMSSSKDLITRLTGSQDPTETEYLNKYYEFMSEENIEKLFG